MKVAIMQPYFLPYIGYFQLIFAADAFVIYDNIKYTKKGWINRNRFLLNAHDEIFTVPLASASDFLEIRDREVAKSFERSKFLNRFKAAYERAPNFGIVFPWLQSLVNVEETNLFEFIYGSILRACALLDLDTPIIKSSTLGVDPGLAGKDRVIATCKAVGATGYLNPIGGLELYDRNEFRDHGIELEFLKSGPVHYRQFGNEFVPSLSIVDVLMFNPLPDIRERLLTTYELV